MGQSQNGLPGQRQGRTVTPKDIVASYTPPPRYARGVIDATYSIDGKNTGYTRELRAGIPMARITASKLWVPCKRTLVNGAGTLTALVVDNSSFFQVGDTITVGADTTVSVTAIDYTTDTLTIASTTVLDGEPVYCDVAAQAGVETCRGFLNQFVDLIDHDDSVARDRQVGKIVIGGHVDASMLLGDIVPIRTPQSAALDGTHYINGITFDDYQGQAS
jgi:hypothetical protein